MAKKKTTTKKDKKTRKERSQANKADHASKRAREAPARAREREQEKAPKITPHPTAGAKVIEFEERLAAQLGPEEAAAQGLKSAPEIIQFDLAVIAQVCQIPFDLWSISQGVDELKLTNKEAILMAKPSKELFDYYLPQIPAIAWAWISLAVVSYSMLKIRLLLIQDLKKKKSASALSPQSATAEASGKSAPDISPPQGQGGPPPSANNIRFPTIDQIRKPPA